MGARGALPKPANLVRLHGGRPVPPGVKAPLSEPRRPDWLALLPGDDCALLRADAARAWRTARADLKKLGLLARADSGLLCDYAICQARLWQCERLLCTAGLTATTERGITKSPAITYSNQLRSALRAHVAALGLSPAARARLRVQIPEEEDELERFLRHAEPQQAAPAAEEDIRHILEREYVQ